MKYESPVSTRSKLIGNVFKVDWRSSARSQGHVCTDGKLLAAGKIHTKCGRLTCMPNTVNKLASVKVYIK